MNKRLAILSVLMSVVLLLAWGISRPSVPIERILPDKPLLLLKVHNPVGLWHEVKNTAVVKQMASIKWPEVFKHNQWPLEYYTHAQETMDSIDQVSSNVLVKSLLSKKSTIAVYQDQDDLASILAVELPFWWRGVALAAQEWARLTYPDKVIPLVLEGKKITKVLDGDKVYYLYFYDQWALISVDQDQLMRRILQVTVNQQPALMNNADYQQLVNRAPQAPDVWMALFLSRQQHGMQMPDFWINLVMHRHAEVKINLALQFNQEQPQLWQHCQPHQNHTISLVPANAISYSWGNCFAFERWYQNLENIKRNAAIYKEMVMKVVQSIERRLTINLKKDILPLLADQVGGYMTDIDTTAMVPMPRVAIFVELTDAQKMRDVLNVISQQMAGRVDKEVMEGVEVYYSPLPLGENLDVAVAVVDKYLLVASSRQLIERSIQVHQAPKRSLQEDKLFTSFNHSQEQSNMMVYMRLSESANRLDALLSWVDKYLASQIDMAANFAEQWPEREEEIVQLRNEKNDYIIAAEERLKEIEEKLSLANQDTSIDTQVLNKQMATIQTDVADVREEIAVLDENINQGREQMAFLTAQVDGAKLFIYNRENLVSPLLQALGSLQAQSINFIVTPKVIETEWLIK